MMQLILPVHVLGGFLGLVTGFIALYAAKGGRLHRKSGMLFVYAMLVLTVAGIVIAPGRPGAAVNIPAALLTAYLVVTALTTVRPPSTASRRVDLGAMVVAWAAALVCLVFGLEALAGGGKRSGIASFPFFMFAVV